MANEERWQNNPGTAGISIPKGSRYETLHVGSAYTAAELTRRFNSSLDALITAQNAARVASEDAERWRLALERIRREAHEHSVRTNSDRFGFLGDIAEAALKSIRSDAGNGAGVTRDEGGS